MTNLVLLPNRKDTSGKTAVNFGRDVDLAFYLGVLLTVGLPAGILGMFFGLFAILAFAGCFLVGAVIGLVNYRDFPPEIVSCVPRVVSNNQSIPEVRLRRAA